MYATGVKAGGVVATFGHTCAYSWIRVMFVSEAERHVGRVLYVFCFL